MTDISTKTRKTPRGTELIPVLDNGGHFNYITSADAGSMYQSGGDVPTSTKWRIRFPAASRTWSSAGAGGGLGVGVAECKWLDEAGTNLATGGTPSASSLYGGPGFATAQAFDGSTATNNGWYSSSDRTGAYDAWLEYDFASAVRPAQLSIAPLRTYNDSFPRAVTVDYYDGAKWVPVKTFYNFSSPANDVYVTYDIPAYFEVEPGNYWRNKKLALVSDSIGDITDGWWMHCCDRLGAQCYLKYAVAGAKMKDGYNSISAADTSAFDLIVVQLGTNDYGNLPGTFGAEGDTHTSDTFWGYLTDLMKVCYTDSKLTRVVQFTPFRRSSDTTTNSVSKTLKDYRDAILQNAVTQSIPVWDAYTCSPINPQTQGTLLSDGLHPNSTYSDVIGRAAANWIMGNA